MRFVEGQACIAYSDVLTSKFGCFLIHDMTSLNTSKKPARKDWHKAKVKAALEEAGWTCRALAKAHDKCHSYFSETLQRPNPRAQAIMAKVIGEKPQAIWPSRYDTDGQPKRGLYTGSYKNGKDYLDRSVSRGRTARNGNVRRAA
jgi:Ner family transcriptional regulator